MRATVRLRRDKGAHLPGYTPGSACTGDLYLTYRANGTRRVAVLQLLGAERIWPNLFEPRLVSLSAKQMVFLGYERSDNAWHLQEWDCNLL
jgi:hypothetical protein